MGIIEDVLRGGGMSDNAVAGIMGNLSQESGFNPKIVGDKGISHGIGQWNKDRWVDLQNFARKNNADVNDTALQARFLLDEADRRSPGLKARMNAAKSPGEAAKIWMDVYESPAKGPSANAEGRMRTAENYAKGIYGKRALSARGGGDKGTSSTSSGAGGTGGDFKMPSRTKTDLTAAKGPDLSGGQAGAQGGKSKEDKSRDAGSGGFIAKNYVEVTKPTDPAPNVFAQRYASFQEAAASKKATFKDLMDMA